MCHFLLKPNTRISDASKTIKARGSLPICRKRHVARLRRMLREKLDGTHTHIMTLKTEMAIPHSMHNNKRNIHNTIN